MKKAPLISIVLPIYNIENYLKVCMDSILNQTYSNLEIIMVDDGSTDKCSIICDEYMKMDKRIIVYHKKMEDCQMREIMESAVQGENI